MTYFLNADLLRQRLEAVERRRLAEKANLLEKLAERYGDEVLDIAQEVAFEQTRKEWAEVADVLEGSSIEELVDLIWPPLRTAGFEFEVSHGENGESRVICTYCPVYQRAEELGLVDWAYRFHCALDPWVVDGFNPNIKLERPKTLMEGDDYCEFIYRYRMDDEAE